MEKPPGWEFQDPLGPKMLPKKVDEEWKRKVREDVLKVQGVPLNAPEKGKATAAASPHFMELVVGLTTQTALQMRQGQLEQAEFSIGVLQALKDKTRGNLAAEEQKVLERSLYELQVQYVQLVQGPAQRGQAPGHAHPE